jgi:hypothetical protein
MATATRAMTTSSDQTEEVRRLYADLRAVQARIDSTKAHLRDDLQERRKTLYQALLDAGELRVDVANAAGVTSQAVANAINGRPGRTED